MWKLVIADDEPRIRRGLKNIIPWSDWNIEVSGEAEDGLSALEVTKKLQPDILFVDINMPFMDGLELIAKLKEKAMDCIIIIITGHDEFSYAQRSIKLNVFDYILKPVMKGELEEVVRRATEKLRANKERKELSYWTQSQIELNSSSLRNVFLKDWVQGLKTEDEIEQNLKHFNIVLPRRSFMAVFKIAHNIDLGEKNRSWSKELLEFSAKNIIEEMLEVEKFKLIFADDNDLIIVLIKKDDGIQAVKKMDRIKDKLELLLEKLIITDHKEIVAKEEVKYAYKKLVSKIEEINQISPIVALAKKYVDDHYHDPMISLLRVANEVKISPTYLSKQLKKELGLSFIDYLSEVRIKQAMLLLNDPVTMVYEVAESVGYSSQHYFSNVFKRITGLTPLQYRRGSRKI